MQVAVGFGGRVGRGKARGAGTIALYSSYSKDSKCVVKLAETCNAKEVRFDFAGSRNASNFDYIPYHLHSFTSLLLRSQWISDVKFSLDGRTLVAGAHDCKIYIYDVNVSTTMGSDRGPPTATIKLRSTFTKHNSVINHLDLSVDGRFMQVCLRGSLFHTMLIIGCHSMFAPQSTCSAYDLLFSDTTNGKHVTKASELRDVKWARFFQFQCDSWHP